MRKFTQTTIAHERLHISKLTKHANAPSVLFIHGGPGMNSATLEHFITDDGIFDTLEFNIVLYDQRSCGRSGQQENKVTHKDNIDDLRELILYLEKIDIKPIALIGHSYGAKLLYDYYRSTGCILPGVFLSTATTTITPRINNLLLDINYLKRTDEKSYEMSLKVIESLTENNLWEISEKLAPYFFANKERILHYWANLDKMKRNQEIQSLFNFPINKDVFQSVREDLYRLGSDSNVDIPSLQNKSLWINGLQDQIMNSFETLSNSKLTLFNKSSHYPHIEEPERFCALVNKFVLN